MYIYKWHFISKCFINVPFGDYREKSNRLPTWQHKIAGFFTKCCLSSIGRECLKEVNQDMDEKKGLLGGALRRGADLSGLHGACNQHSGHLKSSVCPQNSIRMRGEFQWVRRLRTCCWQTGLAPWQTLLKTRVIPLLLIAHSFSCLD